MENNNKYLFVKDLETALAQVDEMLDCFKNDKKFDVTEDDIKL